MVELVRHPLIDEAGRYLRDTGREAWDREVDLTITGNALVGDKMRISLEISAVLQAPGA